MLATRLLTQCALAALLLCTFTLHAQPTTPRKPTAIETLVNRYSDEALAFSPIGATFTGDTRYNHLLPADTAARRDQFRQFQERALAAAQRLESAVVHEEDALTLAIFRASVENQLANARLDPHLTPISPMWSLPNTLAEFGSGVSAQPFKTVRDYDNFAKRAAAFPAWVDQAIINMREGMARGITLPQVLAQRVVPQLEAVANKPVKESIFYRPVTDFPSNFSAADQTRLTRTYERLITQTLSPAYLKLATFVRDEYVPKARTTHGLAGLPDGAARYAQAIKSNTTLEMNPVTLHELGKNEVARIHGEITKVRDALGKTGTVNEFLIAMRADPALYPFKSSAEIIAKYREIQARIEPNLPKQFRMRPKSPLDIQLTPAFRAASASAQYMRPSEDGTRPGVFMFPVADAEKYNRANMEALFLHEGLPGHHFQIALQVEADLPLYRRRTSFTAYSEGWALYTEGLGSELGLYQDPYSQLGRLLLELHRANRLIVDTGLHHYGWTREQAMQQLVDTEGITLQAAANPIERYMGNPGQALAYKVGELKIIELKERARQTLGPRFDVRDFHDEVLRHGGVTLPLLEANVQAWMKRVAQ
ncbi:MAG: hypothetical protein RL341_956 [Pseudomonadota bacterium]